MPGELEEKFLDNTWYDGRIEEAMCDESNSGTAGIRLRLMVTDGALIGKFINDDHWISQKNADTQRGVFKDAFDYDIATEDLELVGKLAGKECSFKIKYEPKFPATDPPTFVPKVARLRKKGIGTGLPPSARIAKFFGNAETDTEWEKDKKF